MDPNDLQFIESVLKRQSEEFQQHVSKVMESFDHKIGLLAEGHVAINERLEQMGGRLERVETRLDTVDLTVAHLDTSLNARIDQVESTLTEKLDRVAADLKAHRADTEAHQNM
ncbi:hypothetical protein GMSM_17330 [Geomonas sp. Red276]